MPIKLCLILTCSECGKDSKSIKVSRKDYERSRRDAIAEFKEQGWAIYKPQSKYEKNHVVCDTCQWDVDLVDDDPFA